VGFSINGKYLDDSRGHTILNNIILQAQSKDSIVDALENIPDDSILFCNFNKIDKFEPTTIHIWMNLLVQFPSSYLFLLAPLSIVEKKKTNVKYGNFNTFESVQGSLSKLASYHGVKPSRIIFVRKASKTEHIQRHSVMDIFLDSFGNYESLFLLI
jgi:predicted O-linked N-acetylglucosamine transferase (SPINDLY family)